MVQCKFGADFHFSSCSNTQKESEMEIWVRLGNCDLWIEEWHLTVLYRVLFLPLKWQFNKNLLSFTHPLDILFFLENKKVIIIIVSKFDLTSNLLQLKQDKFHKTSTILKIHRIDPFQCMHFCRTIETEMGRHFDTFIGDMISISAPSAMSNLNKVLKLSQGLQIYNICWKDRFITQCQCRFTGQHEYWLLSCFSQYSV